MAEQVMSTNELRVGGILVSKLISLGKTGAGKEFATARLTLEVGENQRVDLEIFSMRNTSSGAESKIYQDSHIVMLQILETKKQGDLELATRVAVQLQLTDPAAKSRDRIVKKSEKDGFYTALDLGCVWLERALAGK